MLTCLEHVEEAMDRYLDDEEKLPILVEVDDAQPVSCQFCDHRAVYKIIPGNMESDYE
ncbi:MAG: CxxH/CxxC protein [Turicibacter sp.]|nr:CxxH/CxxC protein [Turicibacter sp.]